MKKNIVLIFLIGMIFCQEEKSLTKMDRFISNVGSIMKLENFKLPDVEGYYEVVTSKVRRATSQDEEMYFLQFVKKEKYSDKVASIAEEDLVDVIEALDNLIIKSQSEDSSADYLEHKFTTEDGFQIGYGGSDINELLWFMTLEKYGDATVLFKDCWTLQKALKAGQDKIKELKAS